MKHLLTILAVTLSFSITNAQNNVVINDDGSTNTEASAMLEVKSANKGLLIPRMKQSDRTAINLPAKGLLVYQIDGSEGFYYYNGSAWKSVSDNLSQTLTNGNDAGGKTITNLAKPTTNTDAATKRYIDSLIAVLAANPANLVPAGTIVAFAGDTSSIPKGWLLCNGRALKSTDYVILANVIKTYWGNGTDDSDPNTTFNLPDLRGQFLRGTDLGAGVDLDVANRTLKNAGQTSNSKVGSFESDTIEVHKHTGTTSSNGSHSHTIPPFVSVGLQKVYTGIDANWIQMNASAVTGGDGSHNHSVDVYNSGGLETRPKNAYVNYIIKY
jgi:microcystin-dependent protein